MNWSRGCVALFGAALLLPACARPGPQEAAPAGQEVAQRAREATCEPGKEVWRSPGPPQRGGVLVRSADRGDHLDRLRGGRDSGAATPQVYNTLVQLRACFAQDLEVAPSLASSWQLSPEGRAYTLKLREGVRWHNKPPVNGRAFTSADVGWTIEAQKAGGQLKSYWQNVGYETLDPSTVVLRLPEPQADFLKKVAAPSNLMLPREIKEQYGDFRTVAVGTGAFMLKEYTPDQGSVLEPNPDYYEVGADGQRLPYVSEVRSVMFADYSAQLAALRAGRVDTTSLQGLFKPDADLLLQSGAKFRTWDVVAFTHSSLFFNLSRKPFDDLRVRKAAALAIDREEVIATLHGSAVHSGFVPAFLHEHKWPEEKLKERFKPDRERARQLLAEAGYGGGTPEFELKSSSQFAQEAEVVQQHLAAVGIRSKVDVIPGTFTAMMQTLDYDMAWGARGGVLFLDYWMGDYLRTGGPSNDTKFSDPQIDGLAKAQASELDPIKRKAMTDEIQELLYRLMPWVPSQSPIYHHFVSCRVKNYMFIQPGYNQPSPLYAWIDAKGC